MGLFHISRRSIVLVSLLHNTGAAHILWIHVLSIISTVLAFVALGAFGGAVLSTHVACLARDAKTEAGHELCWWETGAMCERRYRVGERLYNLRPDVALGISCQTAEPSSAVPCSWWLNVTKEVLSCSLVSRTLVSA